MNDPSMADRPPVLPPPLPNASRGRNGVGIASVCLAVFSLLVASIPYLGFVGIPLAVLGAVLGFVGLLIALIGKRWEPYLSAVGIVLSCVAVGMGVNRLNQSVEAVAKVLPYVTPSNAPVQKRTGPSKDTSDAPENVAGAIEGIVQSAVSPGCFAAVADHLTAANKQLAMKGAVDTKDVDALAASFSAKWQQRFGDPFGVMMEDEFAPARSWYFNYKAYDVAYSEATKSNERVKTAAGGRRLTLFKVVQPAGIMSGPILGGKCMTFEEEGGKWKLNALGSHDALYGALLELQDTNKWPDNPRAAYRYVTKIIMRAYVDTQGTF